MSIPRFSFVAALVFASAAAFAVATAQPVSAAVVIDSFELQSQAINANAFPSSQVQPFPSLGTNALRTLSAQADPDVLAEMQSDAGLLGFVTTPAVNNRTGIGRGKGSLSYTNFLLDISTTPYLRIDFQSNVGPGQAVIELQSTTPSTTSPNIVGGFENLPPTGVSPFTKFYDVRSLQNYQDGFLLGLKAILIGIQGNEGADMFVKVSEISFVSEEEFGAFIPEPSGFALLSVGAVALLGRLRKQSRR